MTKVQIEIADTTLALTRREALVASIGLFEAGNSFPLGSAHRRLYHALSDALEARLEPIEGEVDQAMYDVLQGIGLSASN
jgi:hypothetical protein